MTSTLDPDQGELASLRESVKRAVDIPIFLIAARDDSLVSAPQLLATSRLVSTPPHAIETAIEPCGHLSLFIGRETLHRTWGRAARWLRRDRGGTRRDGGAEPMSKAL